MSNSTRGKETTLVFSVEGIGTLGGGWVKVEGFKLTPDAEIKSSRFLGEPEAEYDLDHQGWKFTGTVRETGPEVRRVYLAIVDANNAGQKVPRIVITATTRYRDGVQPAFTQKLGGVVLKLDDFDVSAGDYAKNTISGSCSLAPELTGAG